MFNITNNTDILLDFFLVFMYAKEWMTKAENDKDSKIVN